MTTPDTPEEPDRDVPMFEPPLDQQPVDQQPVPQRPVDEAAETSSDPHPPGGPQLPSGSMDGPAMPSRPSGPPLIPPLQTTSPVDFVDADAGPTPGPPPAVDEQPAVDGSSDFSPLRIDPPPTLVPTWWLRSAVLLSMLVALVTTMWTEYRGAAGDVITSPLVQGTHLLAGSLIVLWSFLAMGNAGRIVPASRYRKRSSGLTAVALWIVAAAAPFGAVAVARLLEDRLDDPEDLVAFSLMIGVVLLTFMLLWLPFRYHTRQASRVGAPHRAMLAWFFAPLLTAVGGVVAVSIGLGQSLSEDGLEPAERLVQVGVAYGLPMLVFALSTWRAITVFDEVIDLRWRRWRSEWEQTLGDLAAQPTPGPEDSPNIDGLIES